MPDMLLSKLEYKFNEQWRSFPHWTQYFYEVGRYVAREQYNDRRVIVAVALPVRAFAAALAALGVVTELARNAVEQSDATSYFQYLLTLPQDEKGVLLTIDGKEFLGVIDGVTQAGSEQWLKVRVENGRNNALWRCIRPNESKRLRPAQVNLKDLPQKQTGRQLRASSDFSRSILPELDFVNYSNEEGLDCMLVGRQAFFREELVNTCLRLKGSGSLEGCLQDIVRANLFRLSRLSPRIGICRASKNPGEECSYDSTKVTIFDGTLSFLRWNGNFNKCNWIVLSERGDANFETGIEAINSRFIQNRLDFCSEQEFPPAPRGLDTTVFWEPI
jgi:hypothetical protein